MANVTSGLRSHRYLGSAELLASVRPGLRVRAPRRCPAAAIRMSVLLRAWRPDASPM